jgi:hypothetical protein
MELDKVREAARRQRSTADHHRQGAVALAGEVERTEQKLTNAQRFADLGRRIEALPGFEERDDKGSVGASFAAEAPEDPSFTDIRLETEYTRERGQAGRKLLKVSATWTGYDESGDPVEPNRGMITHEELYSQHAESDSPSVAAMLSLLEHLCQQPSLPNRLSKLALNRRN